MEIKCLGCNKNFEKKGKKIYCSKKCGDRLKQQAIKKEWYKDYKEKQNMIYKSEGEVGQIDTTEFHVPEKVFREVVEKDDWAKSIYTVDPDISNGYDELNKVLRIGKYYVRKGKEHRNYE